MAEMLVAEGPDTAAGLLFVVDSIFILLTIEIHRPLRGTDSRQQCNMTSMYTVHLDEMISSAEMWPPV